MGKPRLSLIERIAAKLRLIPDLGEVTTQLLLLALAGLVVSCSSGSNAANLPASHNTTRANSQGWGEAEIDAAFSKEWEAWKVRQAESISEEEGLQLARRGVTNLRDFSDQRIERQASKWKGKLRMEFGTRIGGYRALATRLRNEDHPNAQSELTRWFEALINEVRQNTPE